MDLFVINRYDEDKNFSIVDQENENLKRLKQKIEDRKRARLNHIKSVEVILNQNDQLLENKLNKQDEVSDFEANLRLDNETGIEIVQEINVLPEVLKTSDVENIISTKEFKVLGNSEFERKIKVKRILPHWLSNSFTISTKLQNLSCKVQDLNWLHPILKDTLQIEGIKHLFPVQEKVIPYILEEHASPSPFWPCDVCVSAPTGSGKTLAFVLPIIQILLNEVGHHVKALVILPVQELAVQIANVFKKYCSKTGLKVVLLSALAPIRQEIQQLMKYTESNGWISQADIIVCTAGRLVEHIKNTPGFNLKNLKFLVIDEADRIMEHIQNDWLYHLDKHIKLENEIAGKVSSLSWQNLQSQRKPPHKLFFSATLSQDPEKLDQWSLFQPKLFSATVGSCFENADHIKKYTTPDELEEYSIICEADQKPIIFYYFLTEKKWDRVLCFTNAAQSAHRLAILLTALGDGKLIVAEISAALDRQSREAVLKKFQVGEINVLISTDALARGIDIPNCDYVLSYDFPKNIKTYIHRVGRTGRAGKTGCAVTMVLKYQTNMFKNILESGGKNDLPQLHVPQTLFDQLTSRYENAIKVMKGEILEETSQKVQKSISLKRGSKRKKKQSSINNKKIKLDKL